MGVKGVSGVAFAHAWSPAGEVLVVAGLDSGLPAWDMRSGRQALKVSHPSPLSCADSSADGRHLVSGSSVGEVVVFEASSGAVAAQVPCHTDEVRSIAFSPDARLIASGANDGTVRVWALAR
jgi:WD40 repeat protein